MGAASGSQGLLFAQSAIAAVPPCADHTDSKHSMAVGAAGAGGGAAAGTGSVRDSHPSSRPVVVEEPAPRLYLPLLSQDRLLPVVVVVVVVEASRPLERLQR